MKPVSVVEGEGWKEEVLTAGQAEALQRCGLVEIRRGSAEGQWQVRGRQPFGWAGAARVGDGPDSVDVRLRPKVPIARLLFLVGYTRKQIDQLDWRDDEIDTGEADGVLPAVAHAFARAADRALGQGMLLSYRETEETGAVVRGRIREADQVRRRYSLLLPVETRFDDYTADIPENQLLLTAAGQLLKLPLLERDALVASSSLLRKLMFRLARVTPLAPGRPPPRWKPSRLNARYHTALGLAEVVLRGSSYELDDGRTLRADGLIVLMWKLFEDFVTGAIADALRAHGGWCEFQDEGHRLDVGSLFKLKPDLVYYRADADGRKAPFAVIDAKYKASGPGREDMYQLVAYCTALGLRYGYLISPGSRAAQRSHQITRSSITIIEHTVDLSEPPDAIRRQIRELAADISRRG